jgi:hypothetical protein
MGLMNELASLTRLKKERKLNGTIVVSMRFKGILYYSILSRVLQFKLFLSPGENSIAIATRKWREWINKHLIDRWGVFCADVVLPISHHLDFMIQAFERLVVQNVYLYRMVNGDKEEMDHYHERVRLNTEQEKIRTHLRLPSNVPGAKYMGAHGLLIPLRPTDEVRFRLKIGEYMASGTLLITTVLGEIKYYFESIIL